MEKSAKYFATGLFVTVTVFLFIGFLISLMSPHDHQKFDYYTVEFTDPVNGLDVGSKVQYMGVDVGKVVKAYLVPANFNLVLVDISVVRGTPIRAHTKVVLQAQAITGLVRLEMSTQNGDMQPPPHIAGIKYPVLAGEGSQLNKALDKVPAIMNQVADISKQVDALVTRSRPALERFSTEGLSQLTASSEALKGAATSAHRLSDKLEKNPSQLLFPPSRQGVDIPP